MSDPFDPAVLKPGPDAEADPYHAIIEADADGNSTANVWTIGERIMLFHGLELAEKMLGALPEEPKLVIRGVTAPHLAAMKILSEKNGVPILVIVGMEDDDIEAVPLERAAESDPKGSSGVTY